MATQAESPSQPGAPENTHYLWALSVLALLFFMWGFCTVLNDTLVPHLKAVFDMNYFQAALIARHLFGGGELATPVLKAKHGDASGVRGAAWLWPAT